MESASIDELEELKNLYKELKMESENYNQIMKTAFENFSDYTYEEKTELVLNTVKVYYDLICVLSTINNLINVQPENSYTQAEGKLSSLNECLDELSNLRSVKLDSEYVWFFNYQNIFKDQRDEIIQFTSLFDLVYSSLSRNIKLSIKTLRASLETLQKENLNI